MQSEQQSADSHVPAIPSEFARTLLEGRHIAGLATLRADGSIHLTAIWYLFQDGLLYFPTSSKSQKARNVAANPQATAMIDVRTPGREAGVTAAGPARIIAGAEGKARVAAAQARYLTAKALADPVVGPAYATFDDVVIALTPTRWTTWDIGRMNDEQFGGLLDVEAGYLYPLD